MSTIAPEIPDTPPWLPQLTGQNLPEKGPSYERFTADHVTKSFTRITQTTYQWSQYWRRVDDLEVDCGLKADMSYEVSSGVTKTQGEELTAKLSLGVSQIGLDAEVGSTITSQVMVERSETRQLALKDLQPNECQRLRVTIWQLVDDFVITTRSVGRMIPKTHSDTSSTQVPQRSTRTRAARIDADECCEDQARRHMDMEPYRVSFPGGERILYGSHDESGIVTLEGVQGRYTAGDAVALKSFTDDEQWLAIPEGTAFTYGLLSHADAESWEHAESEETFDSDEQAVTHAFFEMPLDQLRELFDGSDEVVGYVSRIRELVPEGESAPFEDILAAGFSEVTLISIAARILASPTAGKLGGTGGPQANSPVFIYAAAYGDRARALADYNRLLELHTTQLSETYDVAVISKDDLGATQVEKRKSPLGRAASGGIAVGAALSALLPASVVDIETITGLSEVAGHIKSGISRSDAEELGELLKEGNAALIAIGQSPIEEPLDNALTGAEESMEKRVDADSWGLRRMLEDAQGAEGQA